MRLGIPPISLLLTAATTFSQGTAAAVSSYPRDQANESQCSRVVFHLPVIAENYVFATRPNPNSEAAVQDFLADTLTTPPDEFITGTHTVNETFTIHAVYCKPKQRQNDKTTNKNSNTLQILIHGITYNSTMWSGFGFGDRYNWHVHANNQGYHTLAIDRIGHGLNSRAYDPTSIVQTQLHIEAHHQLVTTLRSGNARGNNILNRAFSKIILVGHSYGSGLIAAQSRLYPSDAEILVLTGFSTYTSGGAVRQEFASAVTQYPDRFLPASPTIPYHYGYIVFKNKADRDAFYLDGHHDPAIANHDFAWQDILSTGEFASSGSIWLPARDYAGKVLIVTGVHDSEFCRPPAEECEAILVGTGAGMFPSASAFAYFAPRDAGHDLTLHYGAMRTFERVYEIVGGW